MLPSHIPCSITLVKGFPVLVVTNTKHVKHVDMLNMSRPKIFITSVYIYEAHLCLLVYWFAGWIRLNLIKANWGLGDVLF